jgi:ABC-2 type transport system permease protein
VGLAALKFRQWKALLSIYFQEGLAYQAQGFIWVLTDGVTALIMPQVWLSAGGGRTIAGFTPSDFILYYLVMLLLTSFITSHFMWDISNEIREGTFSTHIIRPIPYMEFMIARNLAWRSIRTFLFLPLALLFVWAYSSQVTSGSFYLGWEVWVMVILGHILSVTSVTALAMIALYTEEAQALFELYYFPAYMLSGQLFPLSVMPDWVRVVAEWSPFYYTVAAPTELIIGKMNPSQAPAIFSVQIGWTIVSVLAYRVLFLRGMRRYTGVGM